LGQAKKKNGIKVVWIEDKN